MTDTDAIQSNKVEIRLLTLTPLWTGGVDRRSDALLETGIIGSLRWWYEAILRGLGVGACDPTAGGCRGQDHCRACELFGCTGWARRFRLQLGSGRAAFEQGEGPGISFVPPGHSHGWPLGSGRLAVGDAGIPGQIVPLRGAPRRLVNLVLTPLQLAATWGGLGARTQHGYGVVRLSATRDGKPVRASTERFLNVYPARRAAPTEHPSLTDFFFARFLMLPDAGEWWTRKDVHRHSPLLGASPADLERWAGGSLASICLSPAVRSGLRYGPLGSRWHRIAPDVFGTVERPRRKTKIHISAAYLQGGRRAFRIWGWLPGTMPDRAAFLDDLHATLHDPAFWKGVLGEPLAVDLDSVVWRAFDPENENAGGLLPRLLSSTEEEG